MVPEQRACAWDGDGAPCVAFAVPESKYCAIHRRMMASSIRLDPKLELEPPLLAGTEEKS